MRSMVSEVGFDSAITPSYASDPFAPAAPGGSGIGNWLMAKVRPAFWMRTPAGTYRWAGYGEPTEDYTAELVTTAVVGGVIVAAGLVALGRWLERRSRRPAKRKNPRRRR